MATYNILGRNIELESFPKLSEKDISTLKNTFKIPEDYTLQQTRQALMQMQEAYPGKYQETIVSPLPEGDMRENKLAEKIADINSRIKLNKDPLKTIANNVVDKINIPFTDYTPIPKDIISKPTAEMAGGFLGLLGQVGVDFAGRKLKPFNLATGTVQANPAKYFAAEFLGTQAGGAVYDKVNDFLRYTMDLEPREVPDQVNQFMHDAYMNMAFTGGSMVVAPIFNAFKRKIGQLTFGVKPDSANYKKMKELAETYGIPFSIIQATNYGLWKAYPKVIGVFPWVGKPFKTQAQAVDESLRQYLNKMQTGLAPTQTIFNLAGDISKIFRKEYEHVRAAQGLLFEDFYKYAEKLRGKKIIDISNFKKYATEVAERFREKRPKTGFEALRFPGDSSQNAFADFYNRLSNLDQTITFEQAIELRKMFSDFAANFENEFKGGVPVKEASALNKLNLVFENDFMKLKNVDNAIDKAIFDTAQKKYATAVDFFANTMNKFEGGIAATMKQAQPGIFSPGAQGAGMLYNTEAFKTILSRAKNDMDAMKHLIELAQPTPAELQAWRKAGKKDGVMENVKMYVKDSDVNSDTFGEYIQKTVPVISAGPMSAKKRIFRQIVDDALFKSIKGTPPGTNYQDFIDERFVDPELVIKQGLEKSPGGENLVKYKDVVFGVKEFEEALGIDNPNGVALLDELLKGTGTSVKDIRKFLVAANDAGSFVVPDASTFLQRRITLTGFKGLLLLNAGARAAEGGLALTNIMIPLIMRYGSELLTDPKALKAITEVVETNQVSASNMSTLLDWAAGTDMPKDDAQAEELQRREEIDSAIFNLMKNPQKDIEFEAARKEQFEMLQPPGFLTDEQAEIGRRVTDMQTNNIPVNMPTFQPSAMSLTPGAREQLAFGTLDQAMAAQAGGIGSLTP